MNTKKEGKLSKSDKPKKVGEILEEQLETSLHEFNRPYSGLFFSSLNAGLEIGFSILLMGTVMTLFGDQLSPEKLHLYLGLCYPLGFIFVIIGRSELFTEHTALAIIPVLRGDVHLKDLFVLWGIVYAGNLLGGFVFSLIIVKIAPEIGFISREAFQALAQKVVDYDAWIIFSSAILAGWMMGLLGWLVTSSQETISRIVVVILVTFTIGFAGLHHCIVGSIEVFSGMLASPEIDFMEYLRFQFWATVGNSAGGAVFVALLKYSHASI
ncbi:MAG: formate/nitrite transporter family protein [Cyclobacteriaceae bacterium]|nr:formate/nitrite transporter family protein [Cyclobacteriaceae bacterium]